MFEYYDNIHMYIGIASGWGYMRGPNFSESLLFSPTAHLLQDFLFLQHLIVFPAQMRGRPMLTFP